MKSNSFERFAGLCAMLVGISGLLYAIAFILLKNDLLSSLFLLLGGLLTTTVIVALYARLRDTDGGFALWALALGILGAAGAVVNGGYGLANAINPPALLPTDTPIQSDPRGLLTFGVSGISLFVNAWLITRSSHFSKGLGYLGWLLAALVIVLYLGRLIILTPTNPVIAVPALVAGIIVNPVWYCWLGISFWRVQGS